MKNFFMRSFLKAYLLVFIMVVACSMNDIPTDDFVDTTAPGTPTNLISDEITSTGFTLSWTASKDNVRVTRYDVYDGTTLIAAVSDTFLSITGLTVNIPTII